MSTNRSELWINGPNYLVRDLRSIEECDQAIAILTDVIADIEGRLADSQGDPEWRRRATRTLSLRKAARHEVYAVRKDMKAARSRTWENSFVRVVKELDPAMFATARAITDEQEGIVRYQAA